MKIFFFTPFYPPQSQAAAVRCYWLIKTLKDAGHEVETFSSVATQESKALYFSAADNKQSFLKRLIWEIISGLELFIRILFSRKDYYILSSPPFVSILIAHLGARLKGAKYILDIRDIYPDVYFHQGLIEEKSLLGNLIKAFTRGMYESSHGVVSVTPGLVDKIRSLAPKTKNVSLLINGVDQDFFRPTTLKYEKFTVIFHGNMGKIQNIPTILKVASSLLHHDDIEFVFIGSGPQEELFKDIKLKNVKYLGPKSYPEIPQLISRAHVGFSARRDDDIGTDAFPVKVFEYLGVEIPVILTPKSGIMKSFSANGIAEFGNDEIELIARKILEWKDFYPKVQIDKGIARRDSSKIILDLIRN